MKLASDVIAIITALAIDIRARCVYNWSKAAFKHRLQSQKKKKKQINANLALEMGRHARRGIFTCNWFPRIHLLASSCF